MRSSSLSVLSRLVAPAALTFLVGSTTAQSSVTITSSKDNSLFESTLGDLSNGAGSRFFTGNTAIGEKRRGLIAFDIRGSVPRCSTILSVTLTLELVITRSAPGPVTLHRVLGDWGEGTSVAPSGQGGGGPATTDDATWLHRRFATTFWTTPGGDFSGTVSGSTTTSVIGPYTWASTPQMVADVQSWLDNPSTNFGWLLRTDEIGTFTARGFATKEDLDPNLRPKLRITYTPPLASVASVGSGCNGSGTSPLTLSANGNPVVPNPGFALALAGGPSGPISGFSFALSLSPVPLPIGGGCFVYVNPGTLIGGANGDANRMTSLPIPNDPSLLCARLVVQGVVVDGVTFAVVTSNALVLTLGT